MAIKIGSKIKVKDDDENWVDAEVIRLGPKTFWVNTEDGRSDVPYHYYEMTWVENFVQTGQTRNE